VKWRVLVTLLLSAVLLAACGPSHGLRVEHGVTRDGSIGAGGSPNIRIAGTTVAGLPVSLTSHGRTILVTVLGVAGLGIQAINSRTSKALGVYLTQYLSNVPASIASTAQYAYILAPLRDRSELTRINLRDPDTVKILQTVGVRGQLYNLSKYAIVLPIDTWLVGTTPAAVWLVSHTTSGYTLWRCDVRTFEVRHFALTSNDVPGVVVNSRRVFVFLRSGHEGIVRIQTRDSEGTILGTSRPFKIDGFQPRPLRGCGDQIFGWTSGPRGVALFGIDTTGGRPRYSKLLPPFAFYPSGASKTAVRGLTLSDHCRTAWAATSSDDIGVVSRLRASSLKVADQINTPSIGALLWMNGSLWGTSIDQAAIVRIR
jgi:hypothetical protein